MAVSKAARTILRSIALLGTVLLFALGVWSLVTIDAIDDRGIAVLSNFQSRLGIDAPAWSQYITAAHRGNARAWILTVLSSTTACAILLVIMSNRYYWLRIAPTLIVLIELSSAISLTIIFGCALSLALDTQAFTTPSLPTLDSADLSLFSHLKPLTRGLAITAALTAFLTLLALAASLMDLQNRRTQARDTRAFEPTVSALGMSHGFHALHPEPRSTTARQPIPTMYDPYKAFQKGPGGALRITKQVAFADEATWMSRKQATSRWSASTSSPKKIEGDIMRLLEVKKARRAVPVRPAAAWTEVASRAPEPQPQPQPQPQPVAVHRSTASLAAEGRSNCI